MAIVNKEITAMDLLDEIEREGKVLIETLGLTREEEEENEEVKLHIRGMELIGYTNSRLIHRQQRETKHWRVLSVLTDRCL